MKTPELFKTKLNKLALATGLWLACGVAHLHAGTVGIGAVLEFETELVALNLSGGPFPMPLASDPGNLLGDSIEGYGFVNSLVTITLSSQRAGSPGPQSLGRALAFNQGGAEPPETFGGTLEPINPNELHGQQFFVDSFFDVFFDITVTDVDSRPGRDYAGQPDGASFQILDNGPAHMSSFYNRIFDKDAPNFGLIPPPEADPYIGHFNIEIPLGGDINGNGENDKIKFTLATHSVGDGNRTFITLPDGTVIDEFDSAAFLQGAVVDESTDPPFMIGAQLPNGLPDPDAFGGPTTATSNLLNPVIPEPSRALLIVVGAMAMLCQRRRRG